MTHGTTRGGRGGYRGRGRGWWRGRGRGRGGLKMTSVDNRPKKILVAGYTPDEKDKVLAHFNVSIFFFFSYFFFQLRLLRIF